MARRRSVGSHVTVHGVPGSPRLTVVGLATSVTGTAQAWVTPAEIAALRARRRSGREPDALPLRRTPGTPPRSAPTSPRVRAALPPGALLGAQSYLTAKLQATRSIAPWVPFIVAFGLIGLVMSVLIVANVVSGAVAAGTRRIGVLKSIGFTPAQVVAAYVLQVAMPGAGRLPWPGVVAGNLLSVPLLSQTAQVYGVGALAVPLWVDVAVPLAMLGLTVAAALPPALRAGRLSAVQAIATGRAPRAARGYARAPPARRASGGPAAAPAGDPRAGRARSPGPARTLVTLAAVAARRHRGDVRASAWPPRWTGWRPTCPTRAPSPSRSACPARHRPCVQPAGGPPAARPGRAAARRPGRAAGPAGDAALRGRSRRRHQRARPAGAAVAGRASAATPAGPATSSSPGTGTRGTGQAVVNTGFLTDTGCAVGDSYRDHVREQARHGADHRRDLRARRRHPGDHRPAWPPWPSSTRS